MRLTITSTDISSYFSTGLSYIFSLTFSVRCEYIDIAVETYNAVTGDIKETTIMVKGDCGWWDCELSTAYDPDETSDVS